MIYSVREWVDWFHHEEASAVLVDGQVVVLSELATALVASIGDGADLAYLSEAMLAQFGSPPDSGLEEATKAALDDLVSAGVIDVSA